MAAAAAATCIAAAWATINAASGGGGGGALSAGATDVDEVVDESGFCLDGREDGSFAYIFANFFKLMVVALTTMNLFFCKGFSSSTSACTNFCSKMRADCSLASSNVA